MTAEVTTERDALFWAKVDKTGDCWLWTAGTRKGYGRFKYKGKDLTAHRVAYEFVRPIPAGLVIDHLCRVRNCVNPDHMEPVENGTNVLRGVGPSAVNSRKEECIHGHPFTPANTCEPPSGKRQCRACKNAWERAHPEKTNPSRTCPDCGRAFGRKNMYDHRRRMHA